MPDRYPTIRDKQDCSEPPFFPPFSSTPPKESIMLNRLKPGLQRKIRRGNLPLRAPSETVLEPGHVVTWNWRTLNQASD